jgi:thioredoxin-like negative regulator of GroEL
MKLVQFSAPNCQSCVTMTGILNNLQKHVEYRNVLDHIDLVRKLNIRKAPALFVMDEADNVIAQFTKPITQENIQEFITENEL